MAFMSQLYEVDKGRDLCSEKLTEEKGREYDKDPEFYRPKYQCSVTRRGKVELINEIKDG